MTIGEKIKAFRREKGISSKELANKLDKAPAYISQIENGRNRNPDIETLKNIASILEVNEEDIILNANAKSIPHEIGKIIKSAREINNVTSSELASIISVSQGTISNIENGKSGRSTASLKLIKQIFTALKIEIKDEQLNNYLNKGFIQTQTESKNSFDFTNILTSEELLEKSRSDAKQIFDVIESLPLQTKDILLEMLQKSN